MPGLIQASVQNHPYTSIALSIAIFYAIWRFIYPSNRPRRLSSIPIIGVESESDIPRRREEFRYNAKNILLDGYRRFKGTPFYVPSPLGERMLLPPHYIDELKNESDDKIDFVGTFFEMFEKRYTTMGSRSTLHPRVTRGPLNSNMDQVLGPLQDEVHAAFQELAPATDDWTPVNISQVILLVVSRASSRMFGGLTLSQDKAWLQAMLDFATDGFIGAQRIKSYPKLIRPLVAIFMPELWRIRRHYRTARNSVEPILRTRQQQQQQQYQNDTKPPADLLQWMADDAKGEETQPSFIADILLKLSFAALHTSAASPVQLVYDLCMMPEYIEPLRQEISSVMMDDDSPESEPLSKRKLMSLRLLDSVMKESLRCNPLLLITFERIVHKDYTFSDGFTIPAGTQIGAPAHAMGMDETNFENPDQFDGYRFLSPTTTTKAEDDGAGVDTNTKASGGGGRVVWAASNLSNMAFGYGKHACPGRFFADVEIKIIMIYILMTYDFKFAEGGMTKRPDNLMAETQMIPNHMTQILLRRRKEQN